MSAVPQPLKSEVLPVGHAQLVLDDAGIIRAVIRERDTAEMFDTLREGDPFADSLHPDDGVFYEHTRRWFASQRAAATIRLRLRGGPQNSWSPTLATFQRRPGTGLSILLVPDDLAVALREETKMRWIIEGSAQGVIVRTADELIFANESMARILGYDSLTEMMAQQRGGLDGAIHPDDIGRVHAATSARIQGRADVSVHKFRYRRRDGGYVWLEAISRFVNWKGTPAETSWISDISDRVRAEEELIASKEAAEFANRTKTEFLANMSHELRTPLNAVIGFSEFMMREIGGPIGTPKYADYAANIHESGQHLLSIINDILDLARLEAGRFDLNENLVCCAELVAACTTIMRSRAEDAGLTLAVEMPESPPGLRADERAVKQVLFNFLSNAIKFTPAGGRITVSVCDEEDGSFGLHVRDTGIGMSASEIDIALAPFGQVDSKLARKHQGTGLGFPICESLMRPGKARR